MEYVREWQYNGVAAWTEIVNWCWATFGAENILAGWETIHFKNETDYLILLLYWS
jgi:hypothetical protein